MIKTMCQYQNKNNGENSRFVEFLQDMRETQKEQRDKCNMKCLKDVKEHVENEGMKIVFFPPSFCVREEGEGNSEVEISKSNTMKNAETKYDNAIKK